MTQATWNPGFPVYIYEEGLELPQEGTYYLVSGNGIWLHKDTGIVHGFIKVDNVSVLQDLQAQERVGCRLPKLPLQQVWQIKEFFRRVVELHHSEAGTILYYNKATQDFKVVVPKQSVSHGGVQYQRLATTEEGLENYLRVGTIHSHCDFGSFHSGTDIGDEEDFDGLHVTFGHNDSDRFTITASVVVNGARLQVDPETVLEGVTALGDRYQIENVSDENKTEWSGCMEEWMSKVSSNSHRPHWVRNFDQFRCTKFTRGELLDWTDVIKSEMEETHGPGPFEVLGATGDKVVLLTKAGVGAHSDSYFQRA